MKKRVFAILLVCLMMIGTMPMHVLAAGYNAVDAVPVVKDEFMTADDTWETGLHITNILSVEEHRADNLDYTFPLITANDPCVVTVLKNVEIDGAPILGASISRVEIDAEGNVIKTGETVAREGVVNPDGYIEAGAVYYLDPGVYFINSVAAYQSAIIVVNADTPELPDSDAYHVTDSKGNVYTLSKPLLGYTDDNIAGYLSDDADVIYIIEAGTTVSAPEGIIFTYIVGEDLSFPDAAWGDAPNTSVLSFASGNHINRVKTSDETTLIFMTAEEEAPEEDIQINPFNDVSETDWYFEDVMYVLEKGLMIGTGDTTFSPTTVVNRAMLVTVLWRLEGSPAVDGAVDFVDVPAGEWYSLAVDWASANRIVNGYGDGRFGALDDMTHEQVMAILHRYAVLKGTWASDLIVDIDVSFTYSNWAESDVKWAIENGMFDGIGSDISKLIEGADRAEMAAYLRRFCEKFMAE